MLKKLIYKQFALIFLENRTSRVFSKFASILEKLLGHAIVNYAGIKLSVGPYGLLDCYILRGHNINPYATSAIRQYLSNGDVFLDIGANHGVLSLIAAKKPGVKVFSFEPSPRELVRLWKNLQLNAFNNISTLSYALGKKQEQKNIVLTSDSNPGMNSLPSIRKTGTSIRCHFDALPQIISSETLKKARVCKIDIEGQEMIFLNSIASHIHHLHQCVFVIEMSPELLKLTGSNVDEIYNFFKRAGFCAQFGKSTQRIQWEEVFYHPEYQSALSLSNELN